jgi:hypothetical protein
MTPQQMTAMLEMARCGYAERLAGAAEVLMITAQINQDHRDVELLLRVRGMMAEQDLAGVSTTLSRRIDVAMENLAAAGCEHLAHPPGMVMNELARGAA